MQALKKAAATAIITTSMLAVPMLTSAQPAGASTAAATPAAITSVQVGSEASHCNKRTSRAHCKMHRTIIRIDDDRVGPGGDGPSNIRPGL
ncbi:hypothetical protein AB0B45_17075 [Nonomuraea sp. NPDC049152]|uniref:hypothetical protein n=1 Tax=Nonomuraea sp. NPDC049152 TaxID=3154350 RepID=UPI0033E6FC8A